MKKKHAKWLRTRGKGRPRSLRIFRHLDKKRWRREEGGENFNPLGPSAEKEGDAYYNF